MRQHQQTIGNCDSWGTPDWIMEPLGKFALDPCGMEGRPLPTVTITFYEKQDGLAADDWGDGRKRVWLNPPFNRYVRPKWMERMAIHGNGIMLVPAACETEPFRDYVFGIAHGILMLNRRPKFIRPDGTAARANSGCTICLVAYGKDNLEVLKQSGLGTVLTEVPA